MTTELETTETQVSEVQKTDKDTSVTSILAQLVKAQESRIDSFEKRFDGLETLIKEQNKNPVDQGVEDDKDEDTEDVKKSESSEYEIVKTVRPLLKSRGEERSIPTGYQILKAISSGWNGQTSSAEDALVIAYNKLEAGEFGNGLPGGY